MAAVNLFSQNSPPALSLYVKSSAKIISPRLTDEITQKLLNKKQNPTPLLPPID